jgi:nicotinate-nucleotide pyrophosphorylase (carboxylating)
MDHQIIKASVRRALKEDRAKNDLTLRILNGFSNKIITAKLTVKEKAILSGTEWFEESFKQLDSKIRVKWNFKEGTKLPKNSLVATIKGPSSSILSGERTALNFLQFMSGISTKTSNIKKTIKNKNIELLDTRKTIPGMRYEQKYATSVGGAKNHRFDLSDGLMIKDNHIAVVEGLENFSFQKNLKKGKFLEIEVKKLSQILPALKLNPDIIMLDNFNFTSLVKAISIINHKCKVEISGIKNESQFEEFSKLDIDFISLGDLTKNIKSIDFSLNLRK